MKKIILTSLILLFSISLVACQNKQTKLDKETQKIVEDVKKSPLLNLNDDEEPDKLQVNIYENVIGALMMEVDAYLYLITEEDFDNEEIVDTYKLKAVSLINRIKEEIVSGYDYENPDLVSYYIAGYQCFNQISLSDNTYDIIPDIKEEIENSEDKESAYLELINPKGKYKYYISALNGCLEVE